MDRSDKQLTMQVDQYQYSDEQLVELKVALHLPYMSNSDYARVDGNIEIGGIHYNYVKRKVWNDTLYVMCLPNKVKTKLQEARNEYASQAADIPAGGKETKAPGKNSQPLTEYNYHIFTYDFHKPVEPAKQASGLSSSQLAQPFIDNSYQPPEFSLA